MWKTRGAVQPRRDSGIEMSRLNRHDRGVGRQIEEAQKKGHFDNLPGKGKPLRIRKDPNVDPEEDAAFKILNDNDFTLPWIEKGRQIAWRPVPSPPSSRPRWKRCCRRRSERLR